MKGSDHMDRSSIRLQSSANAYQSTPEDRRAAVRAAASAAVCAADLAHLLDVLGLNPEEGRNGTTEEGV